VIDNKMITSLKSHGSLGKSVYSLTHFINFCLYLIMIVMTLSLTCTNFTNLTKLIFHLTDRRKLAV